MSPTIVCSTAEAMPSPASGVDAEVADQRRVDDQEQRLGDERAERGNGEPQDVAVQRSGGARHPSSLRVAADRTCGVPQTVRDRRSRAPDAYPGRMTDASRSGLALDELSAEIRPQDDLFRHVNGAWLERTEIPEDKARWGSFHLIAEQAEKDVRAIVEESQDAEPGTESRKIGDLYTSFMDTERIAELGAAPLADQLARVDAIDSIPALLRTLGELERDGVGGLIAPLRRARPGQPAALRARSSCRAACRCPTRATTGSRTSTTTRIAFRAHIERMLELAGRARGRGIRRSHRRARDRARHAPLGQRQAAATRSRPTT